MRERSEIEMDEESAASYDSALRNSTDHLRERIIVELLLDIRELLQKQSPEIS